MTKTLEEHIEAMDRHTALIREHSPNFAPRADTAKCVATIRLLVGAANRFEQKHWLGKVRDAYCPLYTVPEFAGIKQYEKWLNS
jgi:hypothetical protein